MASLLYPPAQLFRPTVWMPLPRRVTGDLGQLTTLASDNPAHDEDQRFQLAGQIALGLTGIQLLQGAHYGAILAAVVAHGCALVLWSEPEHTLSGNRHLKTVR